MVESHRDEKLKGENEEKLNKLNKVQTQKSSGEGNNRSESKLVSQQQQQRDWVPQEYEDSGNESLVPALQCHSDVKFKYKLAENFQSEEQD